MHKKNRNEWELVFILPNLLLDKPYETKFIAIVQFADKRLDSIRKSSPLAKKLLNNFFTFTGQKAKPSALIWRKDSPSSVKNSEAVVAFRNSLAIPCLLYNSALTINSNNLQGPIFSDSFDFSPCTVGKNGGFIISSPAVIGFGPILKRFYGSIYPHIPYHDKFIAKSDDILVEKILIRWKERFETKFADQWETRLLFRSLEMAYQAMATPFRNNSSIYEYGTNLALWVSAFETLVHKAPGDNVNKRNVCDLIGTYRLKERLLDNKRYVLYGKKVANNLVRGNFIQKLYLNLYDSRCNFLHGNQLSLNCLYPFSNKKKPPLGIIAPIIYWVALSVFLETKTKSKKMDFVKMLKEAFREVFGESAYKDALLNVKEG